VNWKTAVASYSGQATVSIRPTRTVLLLGREDVGLPFSMPYVPRVERNGTRQNTNRSLHAPGPIKLLDR